MFAILAASWSCLPRYAVLAPSTRVDRDAVLAASEGRFPGAASDRPTLLDVYRWRPAEHVYLYVWTGCRGEGMSRSCAVFVGRIRRDAPVEVLLAEAVGWGIPQLGETSDRTRVIIQGEDGRGPWRQAIWYGGAGQGEVGLMRRRYADGI